MNFSLLDLFIVAALALAGYIGYKSGAAKKCFTLLALLIALFLAARFARRLASVFPSAGIPSGSMAEVAAFILIFALSLTLFLLLYRWLKTKNAFRKGGSVAGLLVGCVEGLLALSIVFWGLKAFDEPGGRLRSTSYLYAPTLGATPALCALVKPFIPGASEFRDLIGIELHGHGN